MQSSSLATPLVVGVMLTADRPEMTRRAIRSFEAQTYPNKRLLVLDSGKVALDLLSSEAMVCARVDKKFGDETVGFLRNLANRLANVAEIIAHFDSDDWSHPQRLEEQVALLSNSGADCVGYNDMLYCETAGGKHEAWWYTHGMSTWALGGSFCYWRGAWERQLFPDKMKGEDSAWIRSKGVRCVGVSSGLGVSAPRMVAELHGGNTSSHILHDNDQWMRAPGWDDYCAEKLEMEHVP